MSDAEKPVVSFQDDPWEDDSMEFIAADAPPDEVPVPTADLMAQLAELRAEKAALTARANEVTQLREAVAGLAPTAPAVVQQAPGESWDDFNTRLRDQLLGDKPADALREAVQKIAGPDYRQLAENLNRLQGNYMTTHPKWGSVFSKYQNEVEAAVTKRNDRFQNPDVYVEETERVAARHLSDIIAEEVAKQMKPGAATGSQRREFTEVTGGASPRPAAATKPRYRITPEHEEKRLALGMTRGSYYPRTSKGGN